MIVAEINKTTKSASGIQLSMTQRGQLCVIRKRCEKLTINKSNGYFLADRQRAFHGLRQE